MDARRHANLNHLQQLLFVDVKLLQVYAVDRVAFHQAQQHQGGGNALGNHRGDGNALHAHVEHDDEQQVQQHVDDTGNQQEVQGPLGIPHRPQDGRAEVVEHHHGHAHKVNAHVQHRLVDDVGGGAHQLQQRPGQANAHKDEDNPGDDADKHGGVDGLPQILVIAAAIVPRHQHVDANGQADKQVDNQVDKGAGRAHRRQGLGPHELPHHDDVRRVEQQLQNAGKGQRDGKPDDFPHQGAVCHVNLEGAPAHARAKGQLHYSHSSKLSLYWVARGALLPASPWCQNLLYYFARSLARRCFLVKCLRTKKKQIRSHKAARPQVMG